MQQVDIPFDWDPRSHQHEVWRYFQNGGKRAVDVWHRRAGKDSTALNWTASDAIRNTGVYWHMLPTNIQAKKVVWNGIDRYGRRIIDQVFPPAIRRSTNKTEMMIELVNGSIWQLLGSDNYDSHVGANPRGVVFSEWALCDPMAWEFLRPILRENEGWAWFIYTPRGKNHGKKIFDMAIKNPAWHAQLLTIDDTTREDGRQIITRAMVEEDRAEGMPEEMIDQEYFCSWEGGMVGAFYTSEIKMMQEQGRFGQFAHRVGQPCISVWDIGVRDSCGIGIYQMNPISNCPILVEYIEDRNKGLPHYIKLLRDGPWDFHYHFGPHDMGHRVFTTSDIDGDAMTRKQIAADMGFDFEVLDRILIGDGIDMVRTFLSTLCVNQTAGTDRWLECISAYRRKWNEQKMMYGDEPLHDWSSHGADMTRYSALAWDEQLLAARFAWGKGRVPKVTRQIG